MPALKKNKILGQYFSGEFVARLLCSFLDIRPHMEIIDPMAGVGDMFTPFTGKDCTVSAVEIDPEAHSSLCHIVPNATLGNAFAPKQINNYNKEGYDIVITNPPYIRRELLKASTSLPFYIPLEEIYSNIKQFAKEVNSFTDKEKESFCRAIDRISGLADLAIPSWLLCMLLTRPKGQLALVVPSSWMTREYAKPLISLFKDLFTIEYIIKDVNSCLFKGKALVQTNLLVAKRKEKPSSTDNNICILSIYESFFRRTDCIDSIKSIVANLSSPYDDCLIQLMSQNDFDFNDNSSNSYVKKTTFLSQVVDIQDFQSISLSDLGIICNQGFRSGANSFFYFTQQGDKIVSGFNDYLPASLKARFFVTAIQNQEDLTNHYSQTTGTKHYLLTINDCVNKTDLPPNTCYSALPDSLCDYILKSENRTIKGTRIPELSAVRTNVKRASEGKEPRFWYMLPPFTSRHKAYLFMPRVNSDRTHIYLNTDNAVIDANFITFSVSNRSQITPMGAFALLNSSWTAIQFEEICTVLGGGALKIDAVQLSKLFFPAFSKQDYKTLDLLGKTLATQDIDNSDDIIKKIDACIILAAKGSASSSNLNLLSKYNKTLISRRYGSK